MSVLRTLLGTAALAVATTAAPAHAQFFFKSPDFSGPRSTGAEPGIAGQALPDATPAELNAAMVWNMRAALNVAALQCQFEPTLLTLGNYNSMLRTHSDELAASYDTLTKYFTRTTKTKKEAQTAIDQFGTRVYSGFSTVSAQLGFCQSAGEIGQEVLFTPRGGLTDLAANRMRKVRNSLVAYGEQQFPTRFSVRTLRFDHFGRKECWNKKGVWNDRRCGAYSII